MNKEVLNLACESLEISMVYLRDSSIKNHDDFDPLVPGQQLSGQMKIYSTKHHTKTLESEGGKSQFICYFIDAGMRYLHSLPPDEAGNDEKILSKRLATEITATYVVEYAITDEEKLSEEAMKEFGMFNAPHNVWPFWREYLYSVSGRMSMPVSLIPMFRIESPENEDGAINKTT